jgi:hypothetical protein
LRVYCEAATLNNTPDDKSDALEEAVERKSPAL